MGILILGCGGHGRVVADAASSAGIATIAFLDDAGWQREVSAPFEIVGPFSALLEAREKWKRAIIALGDNDRRSELFTEVDAAGYEISNVVHPGAWVSMRATLGRGVFVAAAAAVSIGAEISDAAIINTGATIDHDCVIGRAAHISPGAHLGGDVIVGERAWIGIGASVKHGVRIGNGAIVGAGAAVVNDVEAGATVVGVPARARI
ncbi:MAG: acetyltransferase [Rhizobiaceae bacterium]